MLMAKLLQRDPSLSCNEVTITLQMNETRFDGEKQQIKRSYTKYVA